jgi:ribosomal protein L11 methyltransferase
METNSKRTGYEPFNIGQRFRLISPETKADRSDRIDIIMARGAFGSGEHETTASCIELLETMPELTGQKILDLGSGTAILSIAALKLGAGQALCVDIEQAAVQSAQHNCKINGIDDEIEHHFFSIAVTRPALSRQERQIACGQLLPFNPLRR